MADLDTGLILASAATFGCILLLLGVGASIRICRSSAQKAWVRLSTGMIHAVTRKSTYCAQAAF